MRTLISFLCFAGCLFSNFCLHADSTPRISIGINNLLHTDHLQLLQGKRVGLITNHTALTNEFISSIEAVKLAQKRGNFQLAALFGPEHGIHGSGYAWEKIKHKKDDQGLPIYSLHGETRRPTKEMLEGIDTLIFDIQDIGSRSYTYISTLFYCMEEAAKQGISFIVCDRPNPINGVIVDGPMLEERWRSYVGYINVPYCHGMTVGELALLFNAEYKIGCKLKVIPMSGWKRTMNFRDTNLPWIPTSPHIPEKDTPLYYPATGILGELQILSIGVGYTLPFKIVGAPWLNGELFAKHLNAQKFPGIEFRPFYFRPFYGRFEGEDCQGVLLVVTDHTKFLPVATQYLILGILKSLYPREFQKALANAEKRKTMFCKVNGTEEVWNILQKERYVVWKLRALHEKERKKFLKTRKKYLLSMYGSHK